MWGRDDKALDGLRRSWLADWEKALAAWSSFTKLAEPRWCLDPADEKREQLTGSFAMIRLLDHAVVISLRQVRDLHLEDFAVEVLAHEIGHHVLAPADLRDNARLLARTRAGLPTRESFAGLVANLYTDLVINDRLQRSAGLRMAEVYKALKARAEERVWALYMRIYEILWSLPSGTLIAPVAEERVQVDAGLGARVIRAYGRDWLDGAGRFACLLLPYLLELPEPAQLCVKLPPWFDTDQAGAGDELPEGLAAIDAEEHGGAIHPADDPDLTGMGKDADEVEESAHSGQAAGGVERIGGRKNTYRPVGEFKELLRSAGVTLSDAEIVTRYYRELSLPYLVPFPVREKARAVDPLPEGLDAWDIGSPIKDIDWIESIVRSPTVIPGVTTVQRVYGTTEGTSPERAPVDCYIGVDCSGSMGNPAVQLSYPVLAATVIALSALRAGARVMACLSGEPGKFSQTDGFLRSEKELLKTLTGYLGTGYSFGAGRLEATFIEGPKLPGPAHILVVSDSDLFQMLDQYKNGWEVAGEALARAGGGGSLALQISRGSYREPIARLEKMGWSVYCVGSQEELVAFARAFSADKYGKEKAGPCTSKDRR